MMKSINGGRRLGHAKETTGATYSLRLGRLAVVIVAALCGSVLTALPASAAYYASNVQAGVNVRACARTTAPCQVVSTAPANSGARMQCWRDDGWATGNYSSNRWFLVELSNGQEGFVHSSFVGNQVPVPNCGSIPRVNAALWALSQVGQTYAPAQFGTGTLPDYRGNTLDWVTPSGVEREWSGDCAKLPYIAYRMAGVSSYPLNHAIGQWSDLATKRGNGAYLPRYGDPVFYSIGTYGHTGLYIGGTSIVATQGSDYAYKPVAIYSMFNNGYGTYLGWAKPTAA